MAILPLVLRVATVGILLLLPSLRVEAATHYIVAGGTGAQTGADWSNALAAIPSTAVREDTYYVATGAYGWTQITTATSGSTYIYFRKATSTDHGTATGWQAGYGTGQAIWSNPTGACFDLRASYLSFYGRIGSGYPSTNAANFGFKLVTGYMGTTQVGAVMVWGGQAAANITLDGVEIQGAGPDTFAARTENIPIVAIGNYSNCNSWTVQNCYLHDASGWIFAAGAGWTVDHCYMTRAGSFYIDDHGDGILFVGANWTISNNVLEDFIGTSNVTYLKPDGSGGLVSPNAHVFGNVFRATRSDEFTTQWANLSCTANNYTTGLQFYNNTSYGLRGPIGVSVNAAGNRVPVVGGNNVVQNNVWVNCDTSDGCPDANTVSYNSTYGVTSGTSFGDIAWTGAFTDAANGVFTLTTNTTSGTTLSSPYNVDPAGTTRIPGAWSLGAYQYTGVPNHGQISFSTDAGTVAENAGSITITVNRGPGSSGAVGVSYATADGTAAAGVNYTATSGTLSWPDSDTTAKTFTVPILNVGFVGSKQFTVTLTSPTGGASLVGPTVETVTITGVGSPSCPTMSGWTFDASAGLISNPLVVTNTTDIYQTTDTQGYPVQSGKACYVFSITNAGFYTISGVVNPPSNIGNSAYIDIDATPTDPATIWDVYPVGGGYITNTVGWRGTGTVDVAQFPVKVWDLSAGTHTLNVLGREQGFLMRQWTVTPFQTNATPTPAIVSCLSVSSPSAWYRQLQTVPVTVAFTTNVIVTGTPSLALNNGASATYSSGSGSSNLVFGWTVVPSHDTTQLDYAATNSLTGTIKDGDGTDAVLTLPVPGQPGSISYSSTVGIDTVAPTVTAGSPQFTGDGPVSGTITNWGMLVQWPLTYADTGTNFAYSTLSAGDVTIHATGTATASVIWTTSGLNPVQYVGLGNLTGSGTLYISVAAGTGQDYAGNTTAGVASTTAVSVNIPTTTARVYSGTTYKGSIR